MSYNHLNYQRFWGNTDLFKMKFKREPKVWTIESIHELYLKVLERHSVRQKLVIDCVNRIIDEVQEFEKGKRKVYFNRGGKIYQRELSKNSEYDSWGIHSADLVKFNSDKTIHNRNEKLEFLLSNEKAFELGELYESLQGNTKYYHHRVKEILSEMIEDKLRFIYKEKEAPNILTVSIDDKRYYVQCDDQYRYSRIYKKFKLLNEVNEEIKL
jgi:hypothetical protein